MQSRKSNDHQATNSEKRRHKLHVRCISPMLVSTILLLVLVHGAHALDGDQAAEITSIQQQDSPVQPNKNSPANHRMESDHKSEKNADERLTSSRGGRQYDGPLSTSGTGNYAALSGDSGAYVGGSGMPSLASSYGSSSAASNGAAAYAGDPLGASMYHTSSGGAAYHDPVSLAARAAGYPAMHTAAGYPPPPPPPPMPPMAGSFNSPLASMFSGNAGGGLFSSTSSFPIMAKGFDLAEIVCTAIAVAIGAVIVGAPFILLYLFVMNQMQGNGPSAIGPSGGAISLTGPTSSTTVTGRKKRHTNFSDALFRNLSPLINNEQVAQTFKALMNSLAKYEG